jgi:hypothetical protein
VSVARRNERQVSLSVFVPHALSECGMSAFGTSRKCRPTHLKAAYGSIADSGEPSTRVYEFTP